MENELTRKLVKKELILDPEGKKYLDEIFQGIWHIHNPTPLKISGLGEIIATSIVLDRVYNMKFEYYFNFKNDKIMGDIIRSGELYYIEYREI